MRSSLIEESQPIKGLSRPEYLYSSFFKGRSTFSASPVPPNGAGLFS